MPAFTCARAIGNLWSIFLGVNILRLEWSETLQSDTLATRAMQVKSEEIFFLFLFIKVQDFFKNNDYFIWIFIFKNLFCINTFFLNSFNESLIYFAISSFTFWLLLYNSFAKNNGVWLKKHCLNISSFIFFPSFLISLIFHAIQMEIFCV